MAAGNTVVIKVSKETSLTALLMGELIKEAGLPPGVVNILTGPGKGLGDHMVQHPLVDKVMFHVGSGALLISVLLQYLQTVLLEIDLQLQP